jgi:fibronectin type 3 domain-containing protein
MTYSPALGYGWQSGTIQSADRGRGSALTRDLNLTTQGTFVVDIVNGTYDVKIIMADSRYAHDEMGVFLEGQQVDSVTTTRSASAYRTYRVNVTDGQLTLLLRDLGGTDPNVVINSLQLTPVATSATSSTQAALAAAVMFNSNANSQQNSASTVDYLMGTGYSPRLW